MAKNLAPAAKPVAKAAILLTFGPDAARMPPPSSPELKKYLAQRGQRKPDAVPVMIVIR